MSDPIIDVNINLSRWPTRRLPGDELPALISRLRRCGVVEAWAGTFDAILHKDLGAANAALAAVCSTVQDVKLHPFGTVNLYIQTGKKSSIAVRNSTRCEAFDSIPTTMATR